MSASPVQSSTILIPYHGDYVARSDLHNKQIEYNGSKNGFEVDLSKIDWSQQENLNKDWPVADRKFIRCFCTSSPGFGDAAKEHWFYVHVFATDILRFQSLPQDKKQTCTWGLEEREKGKYLRLALFEKR